MKIYIIPLPSYLNHYYFCPRGFSIVRQGLEAHPDVTLVDSYDQCDFSLLAFVPHANGIKWDTRDIEKYYNNKKLIVCDWIDEESRLLVDINQCFMYFKRSILQPRLINNVYCKDKLIELAEEKIVQPLTYGILDEFPKSFRPLKERGTDIGCYLRPSCVNRQKVLNFVRHVVLNDLISYSYSIGEVSSGSRSVGENVFVDTAYFNKLADTKINIVCNPSQWIGDSRFWESLAAGCLTVVDEDLYNVPGMHALFNKRLITYSINNLPKLRRDLKDIISDLDYTEQLARQSQEVALKHFTSKAIMDYIVGIIKGVYSE